MKKQEIILTLKKGEQIIQKPWRPRKGVSKIYDALIENMVRENPNMSIKDLKSVGDLMYDWIATHEDDVRAIINERKAISQTSPK